MQYDDFSVIKTYGHLYRKIWNCCNQMLQLLILDTLARANQFLKDQTCWLISWWFLSLKWTVFIHILWFFVGWIKELFWWCSILHCIVMWERPSVLFNNTQTIFNKKYLALRSSIQDFPCLKLIMTWKYHEYEIPFFFQPKGLRNTFRIMWQYSELNLGSLFDDIWKIWIETEFKFEWSNWKKQFLSFINSLINMYYFDV